MLNPDSPSLRVDDGADLFFRHQGSGPPLLLLHGLTGTGADFGHLFDLEQLGRDYRWLAPDARGHGRSNNPSGDFSFERNAGDVLALLDALQLRRVCAVGVSLGANTLLHLATLAPERVERAVLVSGAPRFPEATRAAFRAYAAMARDPELEARLRSLHVHGEEQIEALHRLPLRLADDPHDMSFTAERLASITAEVLIVTGDRDPLYPLELSLELYRGISRASLWVVPGGGHSPVFGDARGTFEQAALRFLAAHGETD
jgi:pimeloyl-ACP methyl ester carboxylesterase